MKYFLSLIALFSFQAFAAPEPITLFKKVKMAEWDEKEKVLKFEKGANYEEAANLLMLDYLALAASCAKKIDPPTKAPLKEKAPELKGKDGK